MQKRARFSEGENFDDSLFNKTYGLRFFGRIGVFYTSFHLLCGRVAPFGFHFCFDFSPHA